MVPSMLMEGNIFSNCGWCLHCFSWNPNRNVKCLAPEKQYLHGVIIFTHDEKKMHCKTNGITEWTDEIMKLSKTYRAMIGIDCMGGSKMMQSSDTLFWASP